MPAIARGLPRPLPEVAERLKAQHNNKRALLTTRQNAMQAALLQEQAKVPGRGFVAWV